MFPACLALLMVVGLGSTSYILTDWHRLPTPSSEVDWPLPRTGEATWQDASGDAWLFGGRAVEPLDEFFGDLWVFRSRERAWQQLTPLPGRGRRGAAMCGLPSHVLIIVGGVEEDDTFSDEAVLFDLQRDVWKVLTCSNNDTATTWLMCKHCNVKTNATNSCEMCSNTSSNWVTVVCPPPRLKPIVWCSNETLWMVGGKDKNGEALEDAWQLHVAADRIEWIHAPQASLPPSSSDVVLWAVGHSQPVVLTSLLTDGNQSVSLHQQLWIYQDAHWRSLDSSSRSLEVQWPSERTQASTWTDSFGNLWLYGGLTLLSHKTNITPSSKRHEHPYNDSGNILSQPWMYSVSANVWVKPEVRLPSPGPRVHAFAWAQRYHGFLFGGRTKCDGAVTDKHCICNDLWELNVTYTSQHMPQQYPVSKSRNLPLHPPRESTGPPAAALTPINSSKMGAPKVLKGMDRTRSPWHEQHSDVFGSAIFFGISLSFFAVFGLVVFCRRCVSCPPQQHTLLKEPPPVRYTVIPDEVYIA